MLGAGLLLLSASTAGASTIACGFGGSPTQGVGCAHGPTFALYDFGAGYTFSLEFESVHGPFDVSVTNTLTNQADLLAGNRLSNFPGFNCVTIDGVNCVDFEVSAPAPGANTWTGNFTIGIVWNFDTEPTFPNDPGNRIRILHNRGDVAGNGFNTDVSIVGSYFNGSGGIDDPGIGGRDDNFQSFLVAQAPAVPEPGTLMLLGSGVAWLVRRKLS
jgi:hypothetical protein